jgi:DNA helicase-2/ATP-dependent DNA helicase PcrA
MARFSPLHAAQKGRYDPEMEGTLNAAQHEAVNVANGPLLVLAGAGSGKTRVVTLRIAELIRRGTPPDRILAVTFTNKAATEMADRVNGILDRSLVAKPLVCTFHSYCVRILRRHIGTLGYPANFVIYARGDQESLARSVLRQIHVPTTQLRPSDLLYYVNHWKSRSVTVSQAASLAQTDKEHVAAVAYRRYQRDLKNKGAVDFDDLLLCTDKLFTDFPKIRQEAASCFDHVLIDEYQDTNATQYRIVTALARDHRNLCVVGDDDQSIYRWRGAEVEHLLHFSQDWPGAQTVMLEENYRSTGAILELANRLILHNKTRYQKVLRAARPAGDKPRILQFPDENAEAAEVVDDIRRRINEGYFEPRDFSILFRTNEQPRAIETELRRHKLPYVLIGGLSFFDRREVRDVLAYLRLLVEPEDESSLLRIINTPPRGIGAKAVENLVSAATEAGCPLWQIIVREETSAGLSQSARTGLKALISMINDFRQQSNYRPLHELTHDMIKAIRYEDEIRRLYPDDHEFESRWNSVQEIVNALAAYQQKASKPTLQHFIDDIMLGSLENDLDRDSQLKRNAIALMTLHSAKGLEFPHVYMVGLEEGLLPHHRSIKEGGEALNEERRLCYVGITRAQEQLTLSLSLTRMKWGKPRETQASRFLFEMIGSADNPHQARPSAATKTAKKKAAGGRRAS